MLCFVTADDDDSTFLAALLPFTAFFFFLTAGARGEGSWSVANDTETPFLLRGICFLALPADEARRRLTNDNEDSPTLRTAALGTPGLRVATSRFLRAAVPAAERHDAVGTTGAEVRGLAEVDDAATPPDSTDSVAAAALAPVSLAADDEDEDEDDDGKETTPSVDASPKAVVAAATTEDSRA